MINIRLDEKLNSNEQVVAIKWTRRDGVDVGTILLLSIVDDQLIITPETRMFSIKMPAPSAAGEQ